MAGWVREQQWCAVLVGVGAMLSLRIGVKPWVSHDRHISLQLAFSYSVIIETLWGPGFGSGTFEGISIRVEQKGWLLAASV